MCGRRHLRAEGIDIRRAVLGQNLLDGGLVHVAGRNLDRKERAALLEGLVVRLRDLSGHALIDQIAVDAAGYRAADGSACRTCDRSRQRAASGHKTDTWNSQRGKRRQYPEA